MNVVRCAEPGRLVFEEQQAPGTPPEGWALVDVAYVGICGTDYHIFEGRHPYLAYPRVMGHEVSGTIAAINAPIAQLNVTVMDVDAERLAFAARQLGFLVIDGSKGSIIETIAARTAGTGFDVVFDATGNSRSMQSAFAYVAHGGVMVMVSVVPDDITFSDPEFHKREMMLIGSRNATRSDFRHVIASIRAGKIPIDQLVTHRTTLRDSPRDIAIWAQQKSGLIKSVIDVAGSG
ncbi:zinc-binding dehydrogenase [Mesorhizobium sp.]|uniref:zinc-binding dehydrogenase n=1 Tax=Mesorhizobium sp. TaxID=1871066 RepID=UPI0025DF4F20|nr:zinc-binding dehydrogenase [Mesorhizobium sp.]